MNILCSGDLYEKPITTEECLRCATSLGGKQPCGYGYRLLKSIFESQSEDRTNEIHVTDITGCLRKAYYDKTNPKPRYVHELLPLWLGIAIHNDLDITDDEVISERPVSKDGLIGRIDAVYRDGRIEDAKTTRWMHVDKLPYGNHVDQVNLYAYMNGGADTLQIQMIDMSGPTTCKSCRIPFILRDGEYICRKCGKTYNNAHLGAHIVEIEPQPEEEVKVFIKIRVYELEAAIYVTKEPPPVEPSWLCNYCPHTECPEKE